MPVELSPMLDWAAGTVNSGYGNGDNLAVVAMLQWQGGINNGNEGADRMLKNYVSCSSEWLLDLPSAMV